MAEMNDFTSASLSRGAAAIIILKTGCLKITLKFFLKNRRKTPARRPGFHTIKIAKEKYEAG